MDGPLHTFDDLLGLLQDDLEMFRFPVQDLVQRYGEEYRRDANSILRPLERFAADRQNTLEQILSIYAAFARQTAESYRASRKISSYKQSEEATRSILADPRFKLEYLYILTLSTLFNRSRYELFRHYRQAVARHVRPGSAILEIGGGNCLDAQFASGYGTVDVYELNELAVIWRDLLGLAGRINLRLEPYTFSDSGKYDFVAMVELLEHVSGPDEYLAGARRVMRDGGCGYFTFALRMPQVDHVSEFFTVEECRHLVYSSGFAIREEFCTLSTYRPFEESDRWRLADDPNVSAIYCCVAGPRMETASRTALDAFNEEL